MRASGKRQHLGVQPRRWPMAAPVLVAPSPVTAAPGAGAAAAQGVVVPSPHLGDEPAALAWGGAMGARRALEVVARAKEALQLGTAMSAGGTGIGQAAHDLNGGLP